MRAAISDPEALKAVKPADLAAYFRARGWSQIRQIGDKAVFWKFSTEDNRQFEVVMPLRRDLADYDIRMSEILGTLEIVEGRSQLEIIRDLFTASFDVVRLRARPDGSSSGMVSIEDGVELVQYARELVMAAACSTEQKRAVFASRKPTKALNYVRDAKFGQTEHGSYVLTIVSPLTLTTEAPSKDELFPDGPFGRRVVETLISALHEVRSAALEVAVTGRISVFDQTIQRGVSANLCDAIVGISQISPNDGLNIDVSWAVTVPQSIEGPDSVRISSDSVPIIRDAAKHFREITPVEEFFANGIVVGLKRDPGSKIGYVKLLALIEERPRTISMMLGEMDYQLAVQSHEQRQPVACVGELVKQGRSFELINVRSFTILHEETDQPSFL